jgi:hypothetical protein
MVTMFAAGGVDAIIELLDYRLQSGAHTRSLVITIVLILLTTSLLVLVPYYQAEKTSTREILGALKANWQPGQQIWVAPSYNLNVYSHYAPWMAADLHPFDLPLPAEASENVRFLITDPEYDAGPGFIKLYQSPATTFYPKDLWGRP